MYLSIKRRPLTRGPRSCGRAPYGRPSLPLSGSRESTQALDLAAQLPNLSCPHVECLRNQGENCSTTCGTTLTILSSPDRSLRVKFAPQPQAPQIQGDPRKYRGYYRTKACRTEAAQAAQSVRNRMHVLSVGIGALTTVAGVWTASAALQVGGVLALGAGIYTSESKFAEDAQEIAAIGRVFSVRLEPACR